MKQLAAMLVLAATLTMSANAQENLPNDYLTPAFHAARREALRALMPPHSVAVIFSYPTRTFSNDISYPYHPNPDLYYFSGYKEPQAVLLIFKEPQKGADGSTYRELFFVQQRDPQQEQWTGRRLGVEKTKSELGFDHVYNGSEFAGYPIDLAAFDHILFSGLPDDVHDDLQDPADLYDLMQAFRKKAALPADFDPATNGLLGNLAERATVATLPSIKAYIGKQREASEKLRNNELITRLLNCKSAEDLEAFRKKVADFKWNTFLYDQSIASLRVIKTPEEMALMHKTVSISAIAHAEVMKAIRPGMSELELQGLQEYVHKKLGAEYVGYPSIVGGGANGCILHYEENARTNVGKDMVLMDIGSEYHGYSADVTRTVPTTGKFSPEQKAIYDLVYEAQEAVFPLCHEGTPFPELNEKATEVLAAGLVRLGIIKDKSQVSLYYPHGCSHYLGLDVHDVGTYGQPLKENMVITVEPGIYIPAGSPCDKKWWDIGVRIEDDVRIGKDKEELLSWQAPRKAEDVEKMRTQKSAINDWVLPAIR
ncbi:MAG TPA: aminopeptidase P N-terminal domain-containing protein [Puia sp.]|uniref:aminopeptidase P family protein n=1 Tax=Puia sp. TaxID=2045100 RepID=UPI002BD9CB00|nr:aminopeptidase P N-terminal domain-containing protein [Puia sp.]HVU98877.1 aminopeptidase P N-terminal domain-containing protein [Puia sp.]